MFFSLVVRSNEYLNVDKPETWKEEEPLPLSGLATLAATFTQAQEVVKTVFERDGHPRFAHIILREVGKDDLVLCTEHMADPRGDHL